MKINLLRKNWLRIPGSASLLLALSVSTSLAQISVQWDKTIGGQQGEYVQCIEPTADGGYIIGSISESGIGGDKTSAGKGSADYWIVKIAANGTKEWDRTYGGSGWDAISSVKQTADGGYILGGISYSPAGLDKTEENHPDGPTDYWIVKIAADGTKEWDRTIGSEFFEGFGEIQQTADGGYLLAGDSDSSRPGGDKTDVHYGGDMWVVKLAADGTKLWDKSYGGSDAETSRKMKPTADGGFILGGNSVSDDSWDKSEDSRGGSDYWLVKVDANGVKQWDKTLGGNLSDVFQSVEQTVDGGYIVGGTSSSVASGDKAEGKRGLQDYWVVKLDSAGTMEWEKTIGGASYVNESSELIGSNNLWSVQQAPDGGYLLAGDSDAANNDEKTQGTGGERDIWLVKLSPTGAIMWDQVIGGNGLDAYPTMFRTSNGGYIMSIQSESGASRDKTEASRGERDIWVVRLAPEAGLPVTLSSFSATQENATVLVQWQSTTETNADHFEVEHSLNGKSWQKLAVTDAKGRENVVADYQFIHQTPAAGALNYYRLKMVDADESFTYSKMQSVRFDPRFNLKLYPNPAASMLTIETANWAAVKSIELLNSASKTVYQSPGVPRHSIALQKFPAGMYFVRVLQHDGTTLLGRVIVGK